MEIEGKILTCQYDSAAKAGGIVLAAIFGVLFIGIIIRSMMIIMRQRQKKFYTTLYFILLYLALMFRVASFLDPIMGLCKDLKLEGDYTPRTIFVLIHDLPLLFISLAAAMHTFFIFDFLALKKKSHLEGGIGHQLWYSFVISTLIVFFAIFVLIALSPLGSDAKFQGVYSSGLFILILVISNILYLMITGFSYISELSKSPKSSEEEEAKIIKAS